MVRLPDTWPPGGPSWRDAPSIVGRGRWRCAICQEVLPDGEGEYLDGWGYCHEKCVEEELGGGS